MTRRTRRRRTRQEEAEEAEEEEATDIKSNNPHLAGGEQPTINSLPKKFNEYYGGQASRSRGSKKQGGRSKKTR